MPSDRQDGSAARVGQPTLEPHDEPHPTSGPRGLHPVLGSPSTSRRSPARRRGADAVAVLVTSTASARARRDLDREGSPPRLRRRRPGVARRRPAAAHPVCSSASAPRRVDGRPLRDAAAAAARATRAPAGGTGSGCRRPTARGGCGAGAHGRRAPRPLPLHRLQAKPREGARHLELALAGADAAAVARGIATATPAGRPRSPATSRTPRRVSSPPPMADAPQARRRSSASRWSLRQGALIEMGAAACSGSTRAARRSRA